MATICFYISDYGYGHASRAVALIRELLTDVPDIRIIVKGYGPTAFIRESLDPAEVTVLREEPEPVIVDLPGLRGIDRMQTANNFRAWMEAWDCRIAREENFMTDQGIDLVISDVPAHPLAAAAHTCVPGLVVSNFTWEGIYRHLLPDSPEAGLLFSAYREAALAFVLPFEYGMEIFSMRRRVPLLNRRITRGREEMRRKCGIADDEILVYVGPGLPLRKDGIHLPGRTIHFLMSSRADPIAGTASLTIPAQETETQDWIGMCDLVVAKCGYSTVSEAVAARVPLMVWKRDGFAEDQVIAADIVKLGIGEVFSPEEFLSPFRIGETISRLPEFGESFDSLPPQFTGNGARAIAGTVMEYLV